MVRNKNWLPLPHPSLLFVLAPSRHSDVVLKNVCLHLCCLLVTKGIFSLHCAFPCPSLFNIQFNPLIPDSLSYGCMLQWALATLFQLRHVVNPTAPILNSISLNKNVFLFVLISYPRQGYNISISVFTEPISATFDLFNLKNNSPYWRLTRLYMQMVTHSSAVHPFNLLGQYLDLRLKNAMLYGADWDCLWNSDV